MTQYSRITFSPCNMLLLKKFIFISTLLIPFFSQTTYAELREKEKINTLLNFSMEELLNTEVTGATFSQENLYSVPSSVTVFSGHEIRQMGITSVEDLMNYVPSFQSFRTDSSGNNYNFSTRGRRTAAASREILTLINGQRINTISSGSSTFLVPLISLENVKRIEFIRGSGSALYGSNAFLGVINIVTDDTLNDVEFAVNSFDGIRTHTNISHKKNDLKTNAFIKFYKDNGDKYHHVYDSLNGAYTDTRDPRRSVDIYLSAEYKGWEVNFSHTQRDNEQFYRSGYLNNDFVKTLRDYDYFNISYQWQWLQTIHSSLRMGYRHSRGEYYIPLTSSGNFSSISQPSSTDPLHVVIASEEQEPIIAFHNSLTIFNHHNIEFGAEYRRPEIIDTTAANNYDLRDIVNQNYPVRYYGDLRYTTPLGKEYARSVLGVYGQYQFQPIEPITITAGVRYDRYTKFGTNTSPRLGIVYQPQDETSFKLLYGKAFRVPTLVETDLINYPILKGNPDLEPERSKTWEFVWVQNIGHTNLALSYFDVKMTNFITGNNVGINTRSFTNRGKEKSRGIELEINSELTPNLLLRGTYTHFIEVPERSFRESINLASIILNYNKGKWNFNIHANWQDDKQFRYITKNTSTLKTLPDFLILNSKLSYQLTSDTKLFTHISNVLNNNYYTPSQSVNLPDGVPNRGRQIEIGINWAF